MRNPFSFKNSFEKHKYSAADGDADLGFEEAILDPASRGTLERGGEQRPHTRLLFFLVAAMVVFLGGRFFYLSVGKHEFYRAIAEGNRLRIEYLPAPRGAIYDFSGKTIAGNKPSFELVVTPLDLPKDEAERALITARAADILKMQGPELEALIASSASPEFHSILVRQNLGRQDALIFHERSAEFPGFRVVNSPIRDYKLPFAYSHAVGYVGKINPEEYEEKSQQGYLYNDSLGKTGLEQVYEQYLRGTFGERQVEVDARGIIKKIFGEKSPLPGENLYLNIDAGLQEKLYTSLKTRLEAIGRKRAAAVVMNPTSGRVMGFVSLPGYDNNLFAEGISQGDYQKFLNDPNEPLFNRAIGGTYPPGSTIKPVMATAALQEGIVTANTTIRDEGEIVVKNPFGGPDYHFIGYRRKALGVLNVKGAIALSSDVFFYIVGGGYESVKITGLGINKIAEYFRKFKLHEKLGIDLPGEKEGLVPDPEWKKQRFADDELASRWYLGDTYHVSIGQGDVLVNPLHVLSWVSSIANSGKIYKPFLVDRVENNDSKVLKKFEPEVIGELGIDQKYLEIVRQGMRQAVTEGTARTLASLPITSAAKTGTAQFDARNPNRSHAWFVAYAPYEKPEIAIVVLIEDGGEGGVNSAPVVKDVLQWWAANRYLKQQ